MTDIFRKRPILGNRILVPIRDKPKPKPLRWKNITRKGKNHGLTHQQAVKVWNEMQVGLNFGGGVVIVI